VDLIKIEGLSTKEAKRRLKKYGRDEIKKWRNKSLKFLLSPFISPLIMIFITVFIYCHSLNIIRNKAVLKK